VNILILGSGAREHALAARLTREAGVDRVVCAPGNAGMAAIGPVAAVSLSDPEAILALAERESITLTIVGPELPLAAGVVDRFVEVGRPILGPTRAAARIETSKVWAKQFMARHHVPTARFIVAESAEVAFEAIGSSRLGWPLVIKADGLAAGKGVVLTNTPEESVAVVDDMLTGTKYGEAGRRIVLEECLVGPEMSFFVLSDGHRAMPIGSAQDHKRALDGDRGPNTGGMGAFAPSPLLTADLQARVLKDVVQPVLSGMREEGHPYRGFLYCGLMLTPRGPMVIEFNARLGDPEAQVILPLIDEPLLPLLDAAAAGSLPDRPALQSQQRRVGVVVTSGGYPDRFETGMRISGLADAAALDGVELYHAGTTLGDDGTVMTSGGRVLTVVGRGADYQAAIARAYEGVDRIKFDGAFYRTDIGKQALR
jgi:phosphoribosylamine---glycine ligase